MDKLYTTKEIVEILGNKNITSSTITTCWIPKGLKHIRGMRKGYLYKLTWVNDFIEEQANQNLDDQVKQNVNCRTKNKICTFKVS